MRNNEYNKVTCVIVVLHVMCFPNVEKTFIEGDPGYVNIMIW